MNKRKILLIDSFGILFRSYFALEKTELKTKEGVPTFALYGFFRAFFKAIQEIRPTHVVFALESKSSFRKELDPNYKANRKEQPALLLQQIQILCDFFIKTHIPHMSVEGCEADDVLGSLASYFQKDSSNEVYIYSSDKDLTQLVKDKVFIVKPASVLSKPLEILDKEKVKEKFGVWPNQIRDYLALIGDSSDNVKGVSGIGPKTASQLLRDYHSLDGIYANLTNLSDSIKKKLEEATEHVKLAKELVSLKENLDCELPYEEVGVWKSEHLNAFEKAFHDWEFSLNKDLNLLKNTLLLEKEESHDRPLPELSLFQEEVHEKKEPQSAKGIDNQNPSYYLVKDKGSLQIIANEIEKVGLFAFDTETTHLDYYKADILGVSLCYKKSLAYYIPIGGGGEEISLKDFKSIFENIFANEEIKKIGHNMKYDVQILGKVFSSIKGLFFDTMLAAYLLKPDLKRYSLDDMSLLYLQYKKIAYSSLVDGKEHKTLQSIDKEKVKDYACEDADISYQLYEVLEKELEQEGLWKIFSTLEMPLVPILANMEIEGIGVDRTYLKTLKEEFEAKIKHIQEELYHLAGEEFNVNSPKQIAHILYNVLKLTKIKIKGKKQTAFATDEESLKSLGDFAFVNKLLEHRKYYKLLSTYVIPLIEKSKLTHKDSHIPRIHTSFHQTGTATGRLSSSDPNLQNIPVREEVGVLVRRAFIPKEGYDFASLDYSQIELRLMAHFSKDPVMIKSFLEGEDIHITTASRIFGKDKQTITSKERGVAKTINFGIIYGMGSIKLSKEIGVSVKEAKDFIDAYFHHFQGVKDFIEETKKKAHKEGFVQTILGRKRFFPDIGSGNSMLVSMSERMAVNTCIQGSNADLMKECMISFTQRKDLEEAKMLLQIHDELLFEIPKSVSQELGEKIGELMKNIYLLAVPLEVSLGIGKNWGELKS